MGKFRKLLSKAKDGIGKSEKKQKEKGRAEQAATGNTQAEDAKQAVTSVRKVEDTGQAPNAKAREPDEMAKIKERKESEGGRTLQPTVLTRDAYRYWDSKLKKERLGQGQDQELGEYKDSLLNANGVKKMDDEGRRMHVDVPQGVRRNDIAVDVRRDAKLEKGAPDPGTVPIGGNTGSKKESDFGAKRATQTEIAEDESSSMATGWEQVAAQVTKKRRAKAKKAYDYPKTVEEAAENGDETRLRDRGMQSAQNVESKFGGDKRGTRYGTTENASRSGMYVFSDSLDDAQVKPKPIKEKKQRYEEIGIRLGDYTEKVGTITPPAKITAPGYAALPHYLLPESPATNMSKEKDGKEPSVTEDLLPRYSPVETPIGDVPKANGDECLSTSADASSPCLLPDVPTQVVETKTKTPPLAPSEKQCVQHTTPQHNSNAAPHPNATFAPPVSPLHTHTIHPEYTNSIPLTQQLLPATLMYAIYAAKIRSILLRFQDLENATTKNIASFKANPNLHRGDIAPRVWGLESWSWNFLLYSWDLKHEWHKLLIDCEALLEEVRRTQQLQASIERRAKQKPRIRRGLHDVETMYGTTQGTVSAEALVQIQGLIKDEIQSLRDVRIEGKNVDMETRAIMKNWEQDDAGVSRSVPGPVFGERERLNTRSSWMDEEEYTWSYRAWHGR